MTLGLVAQPPRHGRGAGPGPGAGSGFGGGDFSALKQTLALSDAQVQQIREIQRAGRSPEAMKQMAEQRRAVVEATRRGDSAEAIAAKIKDAGAVRQQMAEARAKVRTQTPAVLTGEQRAKRKTLEEAAKLMPSVRQAAAAGLIEGPEGGPRGPRGPR